MLARIASLNAFLDALFGVIFFDGFCTREPLLTLGAEGNVLAGFDFVIGFLHHFQELIVVLYRDDTPINGLLELLFPVRSAFGFPDLLKANGMRHIRYHDLKHSCASLLLANGVPMKRLQEWLGHSDFSTTANIYAHLDYSSKLTSADMMLSGLGLAPN